MAETPHTQLDTQKKISFSIWPPTQRTRDDVVQRLIESHSSPSIFSKRYGTLTKEEASDIARRVEEGAFTFAGSSASSDDNEFEIVHAYNGVYSKEISKRMLDAVKSISAATTTTEDDSGPWEPL
ncbi:PREDICTED: MFP1 attachment factor 1-like [Nicotiana attenuata]|uniref:Mfp1 attachment factor 1 n=1 Tax=Nicotiana attenuata TaxID=49451 RepID=A0A1J6HUU2_NICAT|nr:PREDICTED: MFP1 attachment factor 1-like [Nicotiana attenuata]OIS96193.1 mfp1 attachment factor 1 [Nicotiana attenuata]